MKAVILAGGKGSRLRPLTFTRPKSMLPLANKPMVEHIVDYLKVYGIKEIAITTNYLREQIIAYLGDGDKYGVKFIYPEETKPLGTAGSVKNISDFLDETFLVIQGDNITDINLADLVGFHRNSGGLCTIAVRPVECPELYGVVDLDDNGLVKEFHEKPAPGECRGNMINMGAYIMEPSALNFVPENEFFDFSRDLFPQLVAKEAIYAKSMDGFWVDIGGPAGYVAAKRWMLSTINGSIDPSAEIYGELQGNVVIGENVKIGRGSTVMGPVVIGNNTIIEEDCVVGPNTCLADNVTLMRGMCLHGSSIYEQTTIGSKAQLESCFIAEGCSVGRNTTVQSKTLIGPNCRIGISVDIAQNSKIWPGMNISTGSQVDGILKRFVQTNEIRKSPLWSLRTVSPEEVFYFNKAENHKVSFTGHRVKDVWEFKDVLQKIDTASIDHHLRYNINDFREWFKLVICDNKLGDMFETAKRDVGVGRSDNLLRNRLLQDVELRLNELLGQTIS